MEQNIRRITPQYIRKSFSFIFSLIIISLIAVAPFIGGLLFSDIYYALIAFVLVGLAIGFYQLQRVAILLWIGLVALFILCILLIAAIKLSGSYVNSLYSYSSMLTVLAFSSLLLRSLCIVYIRNEKARKQ